MCQIQLSRMRARRRAYERLKLYIEKTRDTLFPPSQELYNAVEEIYRYPLQEMARDTLNRQLRSGIDDEQLVNLVTNLRADNHLCQVHEQEELSFKVIPGAFVS